jgi:hypothetical protein
MGATMAIVTAATLAFVVGSLVCWLIVASTGRVRLVVGFLLVVLGIFEIATVHGWLFTGATYSVLVILALATVTTLLSGIVAQERHEAAVPFRRARLHVRLGTLLSGAFSFVTVALIVFFVFGVLAFGLPAATPAATGVLPAPSGLSVTADRDHGCDGSAGPQLVCSREIDLQVPGVTLDGNTHGGGPQARSLPSKELAFGTAAADEAVRGMTGVTGGWRLVAGPAGTWHGCRTIGWWLDKHSVCATVTVHSATAVVTLDVADDW